MSVPEFQAFFLPVLRATADGQAHRVRDLIDPASQELGVSDIDRQKMLPSGKQPVVDNRVSWAAKYLREAGLLSSPRRGDVELTKLGREILAKDLRQIDIDYLMQFPSFKEFRTATKTQPVTAKSPDVTSTPEELLESTWSGMRQSLGQDLLAQVRASSPRFFEQLVIDLLVRMGYGGSITDAAKRVGASGDEGVDGLINEDRLGLDVVYVQAKRWEATVGRPVIQAFAGSLEGHRARKGVVITTSDFSPDARAYVEKIEKRIVLIDGLTLVSLMMDFGVGVATAKSYAVQRIDNDYFEGEAP
jgi:restriction system protein